MNYKEIILNIVGRMYVKIVIDLKRISEPQVKIKMDLGREESVLTRFLLLGSGELLRKRKCMQY